VSPVKMGVAAFKADLSRIVGVLEQRADEVAMRVGLRLADEVIAGDKYSPGTPVDEGFARNSWAVGIGAPAPPHQPPLPEKGSGSATGGNANGSSQGPATAAMLRMRAGETAYITSNCAYMERLEEGHSQQAPVGMVRVTVAAGQHIVDDVVREMTGGSGSAGGQG